MKALSAVLVALPVLLAIAAYQKQELLPPQLAEVVRVIEVNGLEAWQQLSSQMTAAKNTVATTPAADGAAEAIDQADTAPPAAPVSGSQQRCCSL